MTGSRGFHVENKDRSDTAGHTAVSPVPVSRDYSQCPLHLRELLQLPKQSDNREDGRAVTSGRDWVHAGARASLPALGAELSSSGALPPPLHWDSVSPSGKLGERQDLLLRTASEPR